MAMSALKRLCTAAIVRDRRGGALVEFAVLAPVLGLVLAGAVDFGGVVLTRSQIENAVSGAANFAILNAAKVTAVDASDLGQKIAAYLGNSGGVTQATVVVNGGPTASFSGGTVSTSGSASAAGACYCPTRDAGSGALSWGSAVTCGNACATGGRAGKFIVVSASRNYTPLFAGYGIVSSGGISVRAVVQTE